MLQSTCEEVLCWICIQGKTTVLARLSAALTDAYIYIFFGKRKWERCQFFHPIDLAQWAWSGWCYTHHHTLGSACKYNMTYGLWWSRFPLLGIYTSVYGLNLGAFLSKNSLHWICSGEKERGKRTKTPPRDGVTRYYYSLDVFHVIYSIFS